MTCDTILLFVFRLLYRGALLLTGEALVALLALVCRKLFFYLTNLHTYLRIIVFRKYIPRSPPGIPAGSGTCGIARSRCTKCTLRHNAIERGLTFNFWECDTFALLALYEARVLRGCPGDVEDLPPALEVAGQGEAAPDQIRSRHCEKMNYIWTFFVPGSHFTPTGPRILPPAGLMRRREEEKRRRRTAADAATPGREEGGRALNVILVSLSRLPSQNLRKSQRRRLR